MKDLAKVKILINDGNILKNYHKIFAEETNSSKCDKKGMGFNTDQRFSAFGCGIHFDSWKGYYGDSSCSRVISFSDSAEVSEAFIRYIKANETEIINWMAKDLLEKASDLKEKALLEIEEDIKFLESTGE